jgi:2-keto-4-pentenoate hydratase/2-oxohepta-3-ene-1,7-dioic acid hydratase in catechol pathway
MCRQELQVNRLTVAAIHLFLCTDIAHAAEFHKSGFDSSDKNEQPDFPVLFTKRATSIIPTGKSIYTHPNVTSSPDYEGELGIILSKAGLAIPKENAWAHVWYATHPWPAFAD